MHTHTAVDSKHYLGQKHNELRELFVRFVRLQLEDLHIGLIVPELLQKLSNNNNNKMINFTSHSG